jgi:Amt family ammonium transporter
MRKFLATFALLGLAVLAGPALAADAPKLDTGDTAWMLISTVLVIIMIVPGLALFYGGMVRNKNVLSVLMQVFVSFSLITVLWALIGYSMAFSEGNSFVGGLSKAFLSGVKPDSLTGTIPEFVFSAFQLTFAAITPALIVGAFAERMKFSAVLWFLGLWLLAVYAPVAHMVWGGGWIGGMGAIDFAGGTVVHINAGVAGLVAALVLGPRKGYGKVAMPPHNLTFTLIGASLLWAGWFGFNAGSAVGANGSAGLAMMNTQLATAAAVLGWIFAEWIAKGKPSLLGAASGAVAGLVAITPACGNAGPMGAIVLGAVAGVVCFWAAVYLKKSLGYDDSLDAFGVHAIGGIVGALGIGILAAPALGGQGFGGENASIGAQFIVQAEAVGFTIIYDAVVTYIILKIVQMIVGLRVTDEVESQGLDVAEHGESAYNS